MQNVEENKPTETYLFGIACKKNGGWYKRRHETPMASFSEALDRARQVSKRGRSGYVRRVSDGALLDTDDTWIPGHYEYRHLYPLRMAGRI